MPLSDRRFNAVAIGLAGGRRRDPGNSDGFRRAAHAVVIDADGLTAFAQPDGDAEGLFAGGGGRESGVDPHSGEFHRLFGASFRAMARRGLACRRAGPARWSPSRRHTVIAAPDGRAAINANAPPWLATAGTGDVLAGLAAGLLAQGMPPFEAACAAVWMHGEAATAAGPGMISEDLALRIPEVYARCLGLTTSL